MSFLLKNKILFIFLFAVIFTVLINMASALGTWNSGYNLTPNNSREVRVSSANTCRGIAGTHSSGQFFIPTKTNAEFFSTDNHPDLTTGGCYRNLAAGRYVHSTTYNSRLNNGSTCGGGGPWDGLTDNSIPSSAGAECGNIWATGYISDTNAGPWSKWVSLDLGATRLVDMIRVYSERGPTAWGNCSGYDTNSNSVEVWTKASGSCAWNTSGWTSRGKLSFNSVGGQSLQRNFSPVSVRCVRLEYENSRGQWRDCNCSNCGTYNFARELQVWGF